MRKGGESASTIATALGVGRATVYRVLAEQTAEGHCEHAATLSRWTRDSRNSTRVFEFCSGLVDLVVCVGHHGGGGHRLTLAGERFVGRSPRTSRRWVIAVVISGNARRGDRD